MLLQQPQAQSRHVVIGPRAHTPFDEGPVARAQAQKLHDVPGVDSHSFGSY